LNSTNPIEDWYESQISDRARLSFDALLKTNQKTQSHAHWGCVDKQMQGELKGHQVWQWRIPGELPYRILGIFGGEKRAIFLMGYYHKGGIYTPPDAITTTLKRKKLYDRGECKLSERKIKDDQ
jgi:hypothetical protein